MQAGSNSDQSSDTDIRLSFKVQLKALFSNYNFVISIPFAILYFAGQETGAFFGPYGASWFAGCNTWKKQAKNSSCLNNVDFDYEKQNFYYSLFMSLQGIVTFLFVGYIGRLSDAYGRKPFFVMYCITQMLWVIPLIFVDNIWFSYALKPLKGLTGVNNGATPIMIAYVADFTAANQRTLGFAVLYCMGSIGMALGTTCGAIVTLFYGFYLNWFIVTGVFVILITFILCFLRETLPPERRKPLNIDNETAINMYNPFSPLLRIHIHPIVLWIGILQLFISLPEIGIMDIATLIVDDEMGLNDTDNATIVNYGIIMSYTGGIFFGSMILLPILSKFSNNKGILVAGACFLGSSCVLFGLIPYFKSIGYELSFVAAFLLTTSMVAFPAANAIVTTYLHESEQGEGVGIVYSLRSITTIIAPFGFANLYKVGKNKLDFPSLPFVISFMFAVMAVIVILYPLKNAINKMKTENKKMYFRAYDLDKKLINSSF